jgi:hypothetical protein
MPNVKVIEFYSRNIVETKIGILLCEEPFTYNKFYIDGLDKSKRVPVYSICNQDSLLNSVFSKPFGQIVYYNGTIKQSNGNELIFFSVEQGEEPVKTVIEDFIFLKIGNKGRYLIFKISHSEVDNSRTMKTFYRDEFFLVQEEVDEKYDIEDSEPKEIKINYCVVQLSPIGLPLILNTNDSKKIYKNIFKDEIKSIN